jgi:hypothetical protein
VFVQFQGASIDEAIALGTQAADIVSQAFTSPMVLKFERVRDLSIDVFCFMGDFGFQCYIWNLHAEYCVHQWQAHINMVGLCYGL